MKKFYELIKIFKDPLLLRKMDDSRLGGLLVFDSD